MANNYIFGTGPFASEVARKLDEFQVPINGFLKNFVGNKTLPQNVYKDIPTIGIDEDFSIDKDSNIFITKKPMIMGDTIDYLRKQGYSNVYAVSEEILFSSQDSVEEVFQYFDKIDFNIPFLNYLEMNIVDQCNLNCKGCAHFSNIYNNNYVDVDKFKEDLKTISDKFYLYNFRILGGEPLLHPKISDLIKISRDVLKNSRIIIVTNGLLIDRLNEEILRTILDNNIIISISLYQPTYEKLESIEEILKQYNINYLINDDYFKEPEVIEQFQTRLALEKKTEDNLASEFCYGRFCRFLRDGKISKCYYPLLIDILNEKYGTNFEISDDDYVNINDITDGWETIEKLNNPIPFCDYCREKAEDFDWEDNHKNDKDVFSYVLKKK